MLRRALVLLAVLALVVGVLAWRSRRQVQEAERRFDCPIGIASTLPASGAGEPPVRVAAADAGSFTSPVGVASRAGDDAVYVVEKGGRLVRSAGGERSTVLEVPVAGGYEQGLLGAAFSPDGTRLYTNHTDPKGDTHLTEWTMEGGTAGSPRELLFVDQPNEGHNGGGLAVSADGLLYAALGDGGGQFDPHDNAQSLGTLLGKVLRIDPRPDGSRPYGVPADNPFVRTAGARPEIWAYGLRNPWRLSIDPGTEDLWIADVGDGCFEEVDLERGGFSGGANYGWDRVEGDWVVDGPVPPRYAEPAYAYDRDGSATCAVVGGHVYRGSALPALTGWYVFGDLCHGQVLAWQGPGRADPVALGVRIPTLTSFGVDQAGELYATSLSGPVVRLVPASP